MCRRFARRKKNLVINDDSCKHGAEFGLFASDIMKKEAKIEFISTAQNKYSLEMKTEHHFV